MNINKYTFIYIYRNICAPAAPLPPNGISPSPAPPWCGGGWFEMKNCDMPCPPVAVVVVVVAAAVVVLVAVAAVVVVVAVAMPGR